MPNLAALRRQSVLALEEQGTFVPLKRRAPLSDSEQHENYFGTHANLHSLSFSPAYDLLETPLPMDTIAVAQLPMPTIVPLDTDATRSAYETSWPAYEAS